MSRKLVELHPNGAARRTPRGLQQTKLETHGKSVVELQCSYISRMLVANL